MNVAIILSGGIGTRMGLDIPKQYLMVEGKPIICYSLVPFFMNPKVDEVVICLSDEWIPYIEKYMPSDWLSKIRYSKPGITRQHTIYNALKLLYKDGMPLDGKIIIHDAARPLVSMKLIDDCFNELSFCDGVLPVLPVKDTIYMSTDGFSVDCLLDRDRLFAGQSPESFIFGRYLDAHRIMDEKQLAKIKGSTEIAYLAKLNIHLIKGDIFNFKITTLEDLKNFKRIVEK